MCLLYSVVMLKLLVCPKIVFADQFQISPDGLVKIPSPSTLLNIVLF